MKEKINANVQTFVGLGIPAAFGIAVMFYLFDPLMRLVGEKAIGIVLATLIALITMAFSFISVWLPRKVVFIAGIIGWVVVLLMLIAVPFTVR